jgi:hypothetical protein
MAEAAWLDHDVSLPWVLPPRLLGLLHGNTHVQNQSPAMRELKRRAMGAVGDRRRRATTGRKKASSASGTAPQRRDCTPLRGPSIPPETPVADRDLCFLHSLPLCWPSRRRCSKWRQMRHERGGEPAADRAPVEIVNDLQMFTVNLCVAQKRWLFCHITAIEEFRR